MLRFALFMSFFIVVAPSLAGANEIETVSTVKAVTVYQNRAKVVRTASAGVAAGANNVVIKGISPMIDPSSIRVRGMSKAQVTIGAVKSENIFTAELSSDREKTLNAQIEKIQNENLLLEAEKHALNARQAFVKNLGEQAQLRSDEAIADMTLNTEEWGAASLAIQTNMSEILKTKVKIDYVIKKNKEEISAIQQEMNKARSGRKNSYNINVALESSTAANVTLLIDYQTSGANWMPLYDARLKNKQDGTSDLKLTQYGAVTQRTGEDWSDIELTLSTAQPHRQAVLASLRTNWVSMYPEQSRVRAQKSMKDSSFSGLASMQAPSNSRVAVADQMEELDDASYAPASIQKTGYAVEYRIAGLVDVASDGAESKLRIGDAPLEHDLQTYIRPQIAQAAYLMANIKVTGEAPLLAGKVSLYRDDAFIGHGHVPFLMPNKTHELSFGINDNIVVASKTLKDERKEAGMIFSENAHEKHLVTSIENVGTGNATIIVQQTLPTSKNEDLSVEIIKDHSTKGYQKDIDNVKGMLQWSLELAAQQKDEVKLGYRLSWPKAYRLSNYR